MLDAIRLGPEDDATAVTAAQLREVVQRLLEAGQWSPGDADILIVADAGYDVTRLASLLADLPVELLGRIRSDRVLQLSAPPRRPGTNGRPPKHGGPFALGDATTWPTPHVTTTTRYGMATATCWGGPAPPVGTARRTGPPHLSPSAAWLSEHPREDHLPRRCTETRQARPRTTTRLHEPPTRTPLRPRQDHQARDHPCCPAWTDRLKIKLRSGPHIRSPRDVYQV
ncbi:transposase [Streptosporangium roseum]|uniref:transposase n=1 Tax=Streptosporangium roseum TaxID=2001 RepID=UPI003331B32D